MNYYLQLLESYSLLKKRKLKIIFEEHQKSYAEIIRGNDNLIGPISAEMRQLTGVGEEGEGPAQAENMKKILKPETLQTGKATEENPEGKMSERWVAQGDDGPIVIVSHLGKFVLNGWKKLQGQVARRLLSKNPDLNNPYKSSGRPISEDPLLSDTTKTEEERLHIQSMNQEIEIMGTTTIPNLIAGGFAGDPGRVTKEDSDSPGWVKDPQKHLNSYSPQSLWSKVNNEKVTEVAKIIDKEGGAFEGTKASWEDKHEGVTDFHEFAKKCAKLQQALDGDEGAFTDNDARWVHTNIILDQTNNKVRYSKGEIDGYGISFDHTTTRRSKQKETMSVGLARIYNEKIKTWVEEKNKDFPEGEQIEAEQYQIPEKKLIPEQLKSAKWFSNFRGTQAERIVGFVPQILDISKMIAAYKDGDKRSVSSKELKKEIERKKEIMAMDMAKLFAESGAILEEAFKVNDWMKKGEILSDEYSEGIVQTLDALKGLGKGKKEIMKELFNRIVSNQVHLFDTIDSDFVFQAGGNTGPSEKADVFITKVDREDYLRALEDLGVKDKGKRERITAANTKTLRSLLTVEAGNSLEGVKDPEEQDKILRTLLKSKKLFKHLDTTYDLDAEVYTVPLSLKTYISDSDTRLGQTRKLTDTFSLMLDPSDSSHYKKGQSKERVEKFIEQNEKSLGIGEEGGVSRESYRKTLKDFSAIGGIGEMIKGDKKINGMTTSQVAKAVQSLVRQNNAVPSLSDKFLMDYLSKNFERDKEDGRESVRLASFVERMLYQKSEQNVLGSGDEDRIKTYKTALASISMFTGMSADSTFAMEMNLLDNKSKLYNQDDCVKEQAIKMAKGDMPLSRSSVSNDWGTMSLKFERKGNSSVFGLKSKGCDNMFKGETNENVLKSFLKAQALLFEKLLT